MAYASDAPPTVLHHDMRRAVWIDALARDVETCDRSDWESGTIQVIEHHRQQLLAAHGRIAEHVDADFPPWSYLLVLTAPVGATLHLRGHEPLVLVPGMLVEFNSHIRHRLVQKPREDTIWCPLDPPERIELDAAYAEMEARYGGPGLRE